MKYGDGRTINSWDLRPSTPSGRVQHAINEFNTHSKVVKVELREDVAEVFGNFTSTSVHEHASDGAQLVELSDSLNDTLTQRIAARSLLVFSDDKEQLPGSEGYTHGQLVQSMAFDVPVINDYTSKAIDAWRRSMGEDRQHLYEALNAPADHQPPSRVWLSDEMSPNADGLEEVARVTNIETVLAKSAQALLALRDDKLYERMTPTERLRTIAAVEAVFVPLSELPVFDVVATSLLDNTYRRRFEAAERSDLLTKAQKILESAGTPRDIEAELPNILKGILGEFEIEPVISDPVEEHDLLFYHGYAGTGADRLKLRLKSKGAVARKLRYYENKGLTGSEATPGDILGLTIVTKDSEDIGPVLSSIYRRITTNTSATLQGVPMRAEAFHIKGTEDYKESIVRQLKGPIIAEHPEYRPNHSGFQYAKLTLLWTYHTPDGKTFSIPIEIQCVDEESKEEGRCGVDSHTSHKGRKYKDGDSSQLDQIDSTASDAEKYRSIRLRRQKLDASKVTINPHSYDRSQRKMLAIADTIGSTAVSYRQ